MSTELIKDIEEEEELLEGKLHDEELLLEEELLLAVTLIEPQ